MKTFSNIAFFYRFLSYRLVILAILSIFVGVLDGLGLAMFLPLLSLVAEGTASVNIEQMGNLAILPKGLQYIGLDLTLTVVLGTMLLFFVAKGVVRFIEHYLRVVYQQFFISKLRFQAIDSLSDYSYKAFLSADAGKIQNTLTGEIARVVQGYRNYNNILQSGILVITYSLLAVLANAQFALLVLLGGLLSNFVFTYFYSKTKLLSKALVLQSNAFQGLIIQKVEFFKYLKATGNLSSFSKKLKQRISEIEQSNKSIGVLSSVMEGGREPVMMLIVVGTILIQVNVLGGSLSTILISLLFFYRGLASLLMVQTSYNSFLAYSGSIANIREFLADLDDHKETKGSVVFDRFENQIVLDDVSFSYRTGYPILKNISLVIRKYETFALVGESGSGKTTLVNLLTGLLVPTQGELWIDKYTSTNLNLPSFQRRIGYVTQDPVIFDDTIYNNVTFWGERNEENKARFESALRRSLMFEFVQSREAGGETRLGNNGISLSGGQKQRLSIARELYKDVDLLVMDEATSALDSETEAMIQQNIESLHGQLTIIIISHRLSTIKHADQVVVLDRGKVAQIGSYFELLSLSPLFAKMVNYQRL